MSRPTFGATPKGREVRPFSLALAALCVVWAPRVIAAEPGQSVELSYELGAPLEGCPTREEFEASVSRQLGYAPFAEHAPRRVIVRARTTASGLQGALLWRDASGAPRGERQIEVDHQDCGELARSMAFAVVVQLQLLNTPAEQNPETEPPTPEPAASPGPASTPVPAEPSAPAEPPEPYQTRPSDLVPPSFTTRRGPWRGSVGLGPAIASGLTPAVSPLGRLFVGLRQDDFSIELGAAASWPRTERESDGSGFRSNLILATLAPCVHYEALSGCAVGKVGRLGLRGVGLDEPRSDSGLLGTAGVRLALSQALGPIVTQLHVEASYTLKQWTVQSNDEARWTSPDSSFQLGLDVALPFALGR